MRKEPVKKRRHLTRFLTSLARQCRLAYGTKNIVQVAFVQWRGDSKIVEASAEHAFMEYRRHLFI